jgi:hypothetical protein
MEGSLEGLGGWEEKNLAVADPSMLINRYRWIDKDLDRSDQRPAGATGLRGRFS